MAMAMAMPVAMVMGSDKAKKEASFVFQVGQVF